MEITSVIFACDESGAKGYADRPESFPGEVGVFAGILVPEEREAAARLQFQPIYERFKPATGKLHITELPPDQQEALRQQVYVAIRIQDLPCFWYAIHVEGLNNWYLTQKKVLEDARAAALAVGQNPPRVKRSSPRDDPASMHEELFAGLYSHVIAFLEERNRKEVSIEVRTDQIDSPIVKNFEEVAKRLLSSDPLLTAVTGWDTITQQVVKGATSIGVTLPTSMQIEAVVRRLAISTVPDGDGYVLAADVIANSLNHHFKQRDHSKLYAPLNHPEAIIGHPIAHQLAALYDWGIGDLIGDRLYHHPKSRVP